MISRARCLAAALATAFSAEASAVYLNPDGLGQALIYPYYTVRSQDGNAFNTYLSVANTIGQAKVVRVRLREGRNGRETLNFNLYLAPHDMWTGALIPTDDGGAALLSTDVSCTNPPMTPVGTGGVKQFSLGPAAFTGANSDGRGDALDRTRDGYVEMIEMAELTGMAGAAITHNSAGVPTNCSFVQGASVPLTGMVGAPSGGLMGTLTLINVALGEDFTVNAEALESLTTQPFYRNVDSAYPDFDAAEVTPMSEIIADGKRHHLTWARGVDAVSSVLMQSATVNEYVLDSATASRTDWVTTMPTRRFYRTAGSAAQPFTFEAANPECDRFEGSYFNREERGASFSDEPFDMAPRPPPNVSCNAATLWSVRNGSSNFGTVFRPSFTPDIVYLGITGTFQNGWIELRYPGSIDPTSGLFSLGDSTSVDLTTGASRLGRFRVIGLPIVGFMARTFSNGTLACGAGSCQGNYGSAFPHRAIRTVKTIP